MIKNVNLSNLSITKSSSIAACFRSRVRNGDIVFGATELKLTGSIQLDDLVQTFYCLDEVEILDLGDLEITLNNHGDKKLIMETFGCNSKLKELTVPKIACNTKLDYIRLLYDLRNLVNLDLTNIRLDLTQNNYKVITKIPRSITSLKAPNIIITEYIPELVHDITHNKLLHTFKICFASGELAKQYEREFKCKYSYDTNEFDFNEW